MAATKIYTIYMYYAHKSIDVCYIVYYICTGNHLANANKGHGLMTSVCQRDNEMTRRPKKRERENDENQMQREPKTFFIIGAHLN